MESKDRLSEMLREISSDKITVSRDSQKFMDTVKKHGFEHVESRENGSFVVKSKDDEKYFLVDSNREFIEIEKP